MLPWRLHQYGLLDRVVTYRHVLVVVGLANEVLLYYRLGLLATAEAGVARFLGALRGYRVGFELCRL